MREKDRRARQRKGGEEKAIHAKSTETGPVWLAAHDAGKDRAKNKKGARIARRVQKRQTAG